MWFDTSISHIPNHFTFRTQSLPPPVSIVHSPAAQSTIRLVLSIVNRMSAAASNLESERAQDVYRTTKSHTPHNITCGLSTDSIAQKYSTDSGVQISRLQTSRLQPAGKKYDLKTWAPRFKLGSVFFSRLMLKNSTTLIDLGANVNHWWGRWWTVWTSKRRS